MIGGLFDPDDLVAAGGGTTNLTTVESRLAGVNPTAPGGGASLGGQAISSGATSSIQNALTSIADTLKGLNPF
jgi:hypothetical protein